MFLMPGYANGMGKNAGPALLATFPLIILFNKKIPQELKIILLYIFVYTIIWYLTRQRTRHLLPAIGLMGVVCGWAIGLLLTSKHKILGKLLQVSLLLVFIFQSLLINKHALFWRVPTAVGLRSDTEYLQYIFRDGTSFPNNNLINYINNNVPDDSRIICPWNYSGYYIKNDLMTHQYIDGYNIESENDHQVLHNFLVNHGIDYILINNSLIDRIHNKYDFKFPLIYSDHFVEKYFDKEYSYGTQILYKLKYENNIKKATKVI